MTDKPKVTDQKEGSPPVSRQELIAKLEWNQGGTGFGICSFAMAAIWAEDRPGPDKPDLKSIVAVNGPPDKYTDEELAKIVAFAERKTAAYDQMYRWRRGANLILINKHDTGIGTLWLRKRLSWDHGPMYSATLDEALEVMERN